MPRIKEESEEYKNVLQSIAEHGTEIVEVIEPQWNKSERKTIEQERILIVLEMLFQKAAYDGNISAAREYLDRLLGKPKESLKLTNGSDLISKLSDEELTDKITRIFEAAREGAVGKAD